MTWNSSGSVRSVVDVQEGEVYVLTITREGAVAVNSLVSDEDAAYIESIAASEPPVAMFLRDPLIPGAPEVVGCTFDQDTVPLTETEIQARAFTSCTAPANSIHVIASLHRPKTNDEEEMRAEEDNRVGDPVEAFAPNYRGASLAEEPWVGVSIGHDCDDDCSGYWIVKASYTFDLGGGVLIDPLFSDTCAAFSSSFTCTYEVLSLL